MVGPHPVFHTGFSRSPYKLLALALLASGGALAGACSHPYIPLPGTYT
ncbi:hypothetical protein [Deinococcus sp.]|nr:hypothetical protein [Deinococcus sp.]